MLCRSKKGRSYNGPNCLWRRIGPLRLLNICLYSEMITKQRTKCSVEAKRAVHITDQIVCREDLVRVRLIRRAVLLLRGPSCL